MEQIECSETSAYKIQTPGNHPEENIQQIDILLQLYGGCLYSLCVDAVVVLTGMYKIKIA
jgi:hypothetical protein